MKEIFSVLVHFLGRRLIKVQRSEGDSAVDLTINDSCAVLLFVTVTLAVLSTHRSKLSSKM